ncbi:MAG: ribosomal-processing cysteine protease Prp [Lachnospiraceae bacterium]|nr:ribosomal-processing cysteine protease Prp [Lachnospiraceae bacterium]
MISVDIFKKNGTYKEIRCKGHAEYDDYGKDIVCAAVSVLVENCFNSVEKYAYDDFIASSIDNGITSLQLKDDISHDAELLIDSMILGLEGIRQQYGKKYLKISVKEV